MWEGQNHNLYMSHGQIRPTNTPVSEMNCVHCASVPHSDNLHLKYVSMWNRQISTLSVKWQIHRTNMSPCEMAISQNTDTTFWACTILIFNTFIIMWCRRFNVTSSYFEVWKMVNYHTDASIKHHLWVKSHSQVLSQFQNWLCMWV